MDTKQSDQLSDQETARRMENALKRSLATPHKPHKPAPKRKAKPKPKAK